MIQWTSRPKSKILMEHPLSWIRYSISWSSFLRKPKCMLETNERRQGLRCPYCQLRNFCLKRQPLRFQSRFLKSSNEIASPDIIGSGQIRRIDFAGWKFGKVFFRVPFHFSGAIERRGAGVSWIDPRNMHAQAMWVNLSTGFD